MTKIHSHVKSVVLEPFFSQPAIGLSVPLFLSRPNSRLASTNQTSLSCTFTISLLFFCSRVMNNFGLHVVSLITRFLSSWPQK